MHCTIKCRGIVRLICFYIKIEQSGQNWVRIGGFDGPIFSLRSNLEIEEKEIMILLHMIHQNLDHILVVYTPPHSLLKSRYSGRKKCNLGDIAIRGLILAREKRGLARKARKALPRTQGTVLFQNLGQLVFFYPTGWHKEWQCKSNKPKNWSK